tara:strand:- start:1413 stop:1865 length:453 start_codon:yes stop_codon:yes gene_type:complete
MGNFETWQESGQGDDDMAGDTDPRTELYDLLTFENTFLIVRCPECGDLCPAWESTEGDHFADCPVQSCLDAGSSFPVMAEDVRDFVPVLYRCYPHTDTDGNAEIRGFLSHNGEQELIIFTHPESMKGETLEGMSDFIYCDMVEDFWAVFE